MGCSPSDSSVHGILQARILEVIAIPFSRGSSWLREWTQVSCIADRIFTICATTEALRLWAAAAAAKSHQSCLGLCDPIDGSPPDTPIPGILQERTLEWVAISFSNAWKWKVKVKLLSRVRLFTTPWTAAYQAPPSTGFSRGEYWSGVPLPSPRAMREGSSPGFSPWFIDCPNPTVPHIIFTYVYLCLYLTFSLI